jgi:hypothetical protein
MLDVEILTLAFQLADLVDEPSLEGLGAVRGYHTAARPSPNWSTAPDPARDPNRRNGHGSALRTRRPGSVVTQLVTQMKSRGSGLRSELPAD